jgi:hypothetical protein
MLYVYEGAANDDGIPVSGRISGKNLTVEGTWNEHQIEYPSKKEIEVTHFVRIEGTLDSSWFRGTLKIEGLDTPAKVRPEPHGQGSFLPSSSTSSFPPWTKRKPRLTLVSDGNPLRRLLLGSWKKVAVHGSLSFQMDLPVTSRKASCLLSLPHSFLLRSKIADQVRGKSRERACEDSDALSLGV